MIITSSNNEKYKYFKNLKSKKFRTEEYTVEGKKSVLEALSSKRTVSAIIASDSFMEEESFPFPGDIPLYQLPDKLFAALSSTDTPPGIICTIKIEKNKVFTPEPDGLYIYLDHISDPGNMGTIIRTADAAGFNGVLISPGSVELYNPKTVRSSMGSFFRMDIFENVDYEELGGIKAQGYKVLSGVLNDQTVDYTLSDMTRGTIIVIGNESNGVSDEVIALSDQCIKIPIVGGAESLNAAIAAAGIMYEAVKQRSK